MTRRIGYIFPESSLYIKSALAHQKYTLSDGSFREINAIYELWSAPDFGQGMEGGGGGKRGEGGIKIVSLARDTPTTSCVSLYQK